MNQKISIKQALTQEIEARPDAREGCRVCDEIPADELAEVEQAITAGLITAKGAVRVLQSAGYSVSYTTVRRHLSGHEGN